MASETASRLVFPECIEKGEPPVRSLAWQKVPAKKKKQSGAEKTVWEQTDWET